MTRQASFEGTLDEWKVYIQRLIKAESRPIESTEDPRYKALVEADPTYARWKLDGDHRDQFGYRYIEVMPFEAAPLPKPTWAQKQEMNGDLDLTWQSSIFEWGTARGNIRKWSGVPLTEEAVTSDETGRDEPWILVHGGEGDISGYLPEMKDVAMVLMTLIGMVQEITVDDWATIEHILNPPPKTVGDG